MSSVTIHTIPSRAMYRAHDYAVRVDGTTIFITDSRVEADFIALRARQEATR